MYIYFVRFSNNIHYILNTSGKVHSEGDTVINKEGNPYCLTVSVKNKWFQSQYPALNGLASNDCLGEQWCFLADSTAPLIKILIQKHYYHLYFKNQQNFPKRCVADMIKLM